jgi:hypothetical protein
MHLCVFAQGAAEGSGPAVGRQREREAAVAAGHRELAAASTFNCGEVHPEFDQALNTAREVVSLYLAGATPEQILAMAGRDDPKSAFRLLSKRVHPAVLKQWAPQSERTAQNEALFSHAFCFTKYAFDVKSGQLSSARFQKQQQSDGRAGAAPASVQQDADGWAEKMAQLS